MLQKKWIVFLLLSLSIINTPFAQNNNITINKVKGENNQLILDILSLILRKSDPAIKITQYTEELPFSRVIEKLNNDDLSLLWAGVNSDLDSNLLPIRIPILKGLLGHRIFIIKKENQTNFTDIKTLTDLKHLTAGQGTFWGDTQVLKSNNIPTITTLKYPNLFYMLEGERFDYFPRAILEPWSELATRPELNLTVEKNVMLVYPFAMYFFVKKGNKELHDKLYHGFEMAIADGSFNQLFFDNQLIKDALNKSNLKNRTVIRIPNVAMHPDTPIDRKEFWLDINSL